MDQIPSISAANEFDPTYILCAIRTDLAEAWEGVFADSDGVRVFAGHILDAPGDAVVSPANSFGYMNGGGDRVYLHRFGDGLVARLQELLADQFGGELPVGEAVIVLTEDEEIPFLISSPTMREPSDVSGTDNAYLAFRAVLRKAREYNEGAARNGARRITAVLCPGLATGTGNLAVDACAQQMRRAFDEHRG